MTLIKLDAGDLAAIVNLRRDLHAHPELCFREERTSELIARTLTSWEIPVHRGLAKTGVIGIIRGREGPRSIGIRADIDALPMTEENRFPHASVYPGRMHGCGHDGHAAMLLAAARYLSLHREFEGTVYVIFQPAEEGGGGAQVMIREGLFDLFPMEAIFAAHNWPGLSVGHFSIASGPVLASSTEFKVTIRGRGAHAAMPHDAVDPIPAACQIVQAFQTVISRNRPPMDPGVVSVTMVHAGEASNVIPDFCEIQGSVRTFTIEVLDMIEQRMRQISESTCAAFGATCDFHFRRIYPPTINHSAETEFARRVLINLVGANRVEDFKPMTGSEDFSFFLQEKPGCYFMIGNGGGTHRMSEHGPGPCNLHNGSYDFNDDLIPLGGSAWARLAEQWLNSKGTEKMEMVRQVRDE